MASSEPPGIDGRTSQTAWTSSFDDTGNMSIDKNIGKGDFMDQFKALLIRNLTLKMRDKRKTITEFFMPLYWITILAIIRVTTPDTKYGPILEPHGTAPLMERVYTSLNNQTLHVVPHNEEVQNVVKEIQYLASNYSAVIDVTYYDTEAELEDFFKNTSISIAVVFSEDPVKNNTYVLRFSPIGSPIPSASHLWSDGSTCRNQNPQYGLQMLNCPANGYFFSGFSALQTLIDIAIIRKKTKSEVEVPHIILQNFPKDAFQSGGRMILRNIVPLYMVFAWAQFIVYMMMLVVEEKEKKIKESMKMMGLRDSVYWLSWFAVYGAYVVALALICIIVLPLAQVFRHANIFLLFMLFFLYGCSSIVFALMLTPFFNRAKVAGIVANLIQVALSLLFYLQVYLEKDIDQGVFWALALLSPCAFSFALDKVIMFDYSSGGLDYSKLWDGPGLPFAGSLIMITLDIFIYLFLAYYLDNIVPSEYGTKRKPWFLFQKSFWVQNNKKFQFMSLKAENNEGFENHEIPANPDVEPVSSELQGKIAVSIRNLKKTFHRSRKEPVKAVDDFSLNIYEGQITAILGHNGAGKTTLFNILTGMTDPTEGSATIFGMDIRDANDLSYIRRITGVCPQHDVIFMTLTPREHLRFFARIRGISSDKLDAEVDQTLEEVDLSSKGDTRASDLSGGQKRKLSIGIALIGDPKIIFLDEPTAGVDAYSRRRLWTLLKNRKQGKVILLTTHFMDEADILADRKAIMSQGKLRCCGSSLFLKNKFGLGYHLTLVVAEDADADVISEAVKKIVPGVQMARFYGKEMSFILPSDSTEQFPQLFTQLDQHITSTEENIAIEGYGISMTSLEEVFLTLSEENEDCELQAMENLGHQMICEKPLSASPQHRAMPDSRLDNDYELHTTDSKGFAINTVEVRRDTWRAFKALLKMRFINVSREKVAVFVLIFMPLAFTVGSIALANSQVIQLPTDEKLSLVPEIYEPNLYGTLLHNASDDNLTALELVFESVDMSVDNYNGSYKEIFSLGMHMSALNVQSFHSTKNVDSASLTLVFNDTYVHAIPILINLLNNAILRSLNESDMISVSTQFLPKFKGNAVFDVSSFLAPMMIGFAFTLIPAILATDFVNDREIMARNMLRLNGVGFNLYFSSYFLLMGAMYMVTYIGLLIIIAAFNVSSLIILPAFGAIAVLYLLYMPSALLFSATLSYIFDKAETARQFYPNMATTIGFLSYMAVYFVDTFAVTDNIQPSLILHIIFAIFLPYYVPFGLLFFINKIYIVCSLSSTCDELTASSYMTTEIIVLFVVILIDIPLYYILLRLADTLKLGGSWRDALWLRKKAKVGYSSHNDEAGVAEPLGEDDDVKEERANVAATMRDGGDVPPVLIYDLGKVYKKGVEGDQNPCRREKETKEFVALKSVSLEVKNGQVFGLLGPNGAGKTTSLRIITAEESPTKGKVNICGEDVLSSLSNVFETMGYCPQHNALWRNVSVAEHIECYAEVRGIQKDQVNLLVDTYLKGLEIEEHRKKMSKDCSGGTKRKLSYIISMLGSPQVVLLDEPSTGMDPKSKRFLWNSILASFKGKRSAILTTHSMEEADALCSRIGILVRGVLRCIGAIQHLKNKYGGGYNLEVKVKHQKPFAVCDINASSSLSSEEPSTTMEQLHDMIKETFPNAVLDEQFEERITYKIPQTDVTSLSGCFGMLEKAKTEGLVEEYALSQTTVEQVFLQFARQQEEDENEEEGASNSGQCTSL